MPADFFIMVMAVLDFLLMQINSSLFKLTVYNQSAVRMFKVFKSLRALRAIRVLRGLRSAGPQLPTLVTGDSEGSGDAGLHSQGCAVTWSRDGSSGVADSSLVLISSLTVTIFIFLRGAGTLPSHWQIRDLLPSASGLAPGHRSPPSLTQPPSHPLPTAS